ncbi:efflux RND transporter periplasmic adaptor subunit [Flavihumibacter profundi]|uniref:efflux RND transporter periplasmic adaptor subunit n=1 Tax=Flavihumibacter profundi TaxID=2716883 RepID=UPI001CC3FC4E|nr:efflux RND transporter periplasmic adaptor subunit [Flavihumibacter profundi]MBZ5858360.1 efflux RND transporter periplasmic adaptor subunit [Flavihumibacter profundi]
MKKYFIILPLIAAVACNHAENAKKETTSAPAKQYNIAAITTSNLSPVIKLPGELKPFEIVQLYPKVNSFVKEVLVDRGSKVKKGQVLIRLEAPEIEQQYYAAKSKYLQAYSIFIASKDNYERLLTTSQTPGTVSAHDITLANARMLADSASMQGEIANYKGLEANMQYLTVTAPFDGIISERNVHPGALVGPNLKTDDKAMLVLQQEEKLRLIINIPEVYSNQLKNKNALNFTVSTLPGKSFKGILDRSAGALDLKYRSEAMEADVINTDRLLKPGMYAEVELPVQRSGLAMVVPSSSIITSTEGKYIISVKNGKAFRISIQEGNTQHDSTEIFGDIKVGEKIIVTASDDIKDGAIIK